MMDPIRMTPEPPIMGITQATLSARWISIGLLGGHQSLVVERDEWSNFMKFIHEVDERVNQTDGTR